MDTPPIPADLWGQIPLPAQSAVTDLVRRHEENLRAFQAALDAHVAGWPVPAQRHEIVAAIRAGDQSWARFPYYARRYGDRGRTYTARDSLWLVGLAARPDVEVYSQVRWLGQVLAARGMPRWLLECHLEVLYRELEGLSPTGGGAYRGLVKAAGLLRAEREDWIGDALLEELAAGFAVQVQPELAAGLPEAGRLLGAAVADEQCGVDRAVTSLEEWMTDRSRFPVEWVEAVGATIRAARERAGKRPK